MPGAPSPPTAFPDLTDAPVEIAGELVILPPSVTLPTAGLHLLRAGVPAGRLQKGRFVPAHALFMAWGTRCANAEPPHPERPRALRRGSGERKLTPSPLRMAGARCWWTDFRWGTAKSAVVG